MFVNHDQNSLPFLWIEKEIVLNFTYKHEEDGLLVLEKEYFPATKPMPTSNAVTHQRIVLKCRISSQLFEDLLWFFWWMNQSPLIESKYLHYPNLSSRVCLRGGLADENSFQWTANFILLDYGIKVCTWPAFLMCSCFWIVKWFVEVYCNMCRFVFFVKAAYYDIGIRKWQKGFMIWKSFQSRKQTF